jgi:hypothetical protein
MFIVDERLDDGAVAFLDELPEAADELDAASGSPEGSSAPIADAMRFLSAAPLPLPDGGGSSKLDTTLPTTLPGEAAVAAAIPPGIGCEVAPLELVGLGTLPEAPERREG